MGKANSKLSPEIVVELQKTTHYDRKEILSLHRDFLRECPSGTITREHFLKMFEGYFPFGDPTAFAGQLFRLYDADRNGLINFGEYLTGLSITTRGRVGEKIEWAFQLYDQDGDGVISRADMLLVVDAIYRMMGELVQAPEGEESPAARVDKLFSRFGKVEDGKQVFMHQLTMEEFKEGIEKDPAILQALLMYDGAI